ncbi:aspartate kinase [Candidatus Peregrinibacteria bacterium]|nr:aspartate kinase [Candidatus Peregrinibacteria bacterium]
MAKLDQVLGLISVLERRGENMVFVVSAFKGVTNTLIAAMDALNGLDYSQEDIQRAFAKTHEIHTAIIEKFFHDEFKEQAKQTYATAFDVLTQSLLTHKKVTRILMPVDGSFQMRDQVIGFGERMAGALLNLYCAQEGKQSKFVDDVRCDKDAMGNGVISNRKLQKGVQSGIKTALNGTKADIIRILGGHVAGTPRGIAIDEGRGYSDITAADAAIALQEKGEAVKATRFWKDVDGVYTTNPKELDLTKNKPVLHRDISAEEALENAAAGSGLLNVRALSRALEHDLDLQIRNINKADQDVGTNITRGDVLTHHAFKTIVVNPNIDSLTVNIPEMADQYGFAEAIAKAFNKHGISLDGIFSEGTSITFSVPMPQDASDMEAYREKIRSVQAELKEVEVNGERYAAPQPPTWNKGRLACISIIGKELRDQVGILSMISGVLSAWGINIECVSHGSSQTRVSFLIDQGKSTMAVQLLHSIFVDNDPKVKKQFVERQTERLQALTRTFQR